VDCIYQIRDGSNAILPNEHFSYPDGYPEIIINLGGAYFREDMVTHKIEKIHHGTCVFIGIKARSFRILQEGTCDIVGIKLKPHGLSLLSGKHQGETLNKTVCGSKVFGNEVSTLLSTLFDCPLRERIQLLTNFLSQQRLTGSVYSSFLEVVQTINDHQGLVQIQSLCDRFSINPRTLENQFKQYIGSSPKEYCKIVQFNHFQVRSFDVSKALAQVAVDCGYYDQAHLIRTFRSFMHSSPRKHFNSFNSLNRINLEILQQQIQPDHIMAQ